MKKKSSPPVEVNEAPAAPVAEPHPAHVNNFGHAFYTGKPDVNPDNDLLEFGDPLDYHKNLNRENR